VSDPAKAGGDLRYSKQRHRTPEGVPAWCGALVALETTRALRDLARLVSLQDAERLNGLMTRGVSLRAATPGYQLSSLRDGQPKAYGVRLTHLRGRG
jgi:hypothetical protein